MMGFDVGRPSGVNEHGEPEDTVNAERHGLSSTHKRHDCRLLLVAKSKATCWTSLNMGDCVFFETDHTGQKLDRQIRPNLAMRFPKSRASNHCVAHRRHQQLGCAPI